MLEAARVCLPWVEIYAKTDGGAAHATKLIRAILKKVETAFANQGNATLFRCGCGEPMEFDERTSLWGCERCGARMNDIEILSKVVEMPVGDTWKSRGDDCVKHTWRRHSLGRQTCPYCEDEMTPGGRRA